MTPQQSRVPQSGPGPDRYPRVVVLTKRAVMSSGPFVENLVSEHNVVAVFAERRVTSVSSSWLRYAVNRFREHGFLRLARYACETIAQRYVRRECVEVVAARRPEVPYHPVNEINDEDVVDRIRSYRPDIIVTGSTRLAKEPILEIPPLGCLNIHGAMLPRNAGIEPTFWALLEEEFDAVGETIHFAVPQADAGHIVVQERIPFALGETVEEIDGRIIRHGAELISRAVSAVANGTAQARPMDLGRYSYKGRPALPQRRELDAKIRRWRSEWRGQKPHLRLWTTEEVAAYRAQQASNRR